jgi:histidinol-phosphate/aromatic aminotransferase/cobyric acid decarboxylase-like protein/short-subunit dehydrogenase
MIKYIIILFIVILLFNINKNNNENFNSNKKTILITGSTNGIGLTVANSLDINNYQLIITGRNLNKINTIVNNLKEKGMDVYGIKADLSKEIEINKLVDSIINKYGKIDIFINNMYYLPKMINFNNLDIESLKDQIKVNFTNNIILTNYILKYMKKNNNGRIINISSGASDMNNGNNFAQLYIIIKKQIEKITKLLSMEFYKKNISITCLKINDSYRSEMTKNFLNNINLKSPEELIPIFEYILNINKNVINGRIINSHTYLNNKNISLLELPYDVDSYYSNNYLLDENRDGEYKLYLGENVLGMSPNIKKLIRNYDWDLSKYPSKGKKLKEIITKKYFVENDNICITKGITNTLILIISNFVKKFHEILITNPSWFRFIEICDSKNLTKIKSECNIINNNIKINFNDLLMKITPLTRLIYLVYPFDIKNFESFLEQLPFNIIVIIDLCYYNFINDEYPIDIKKHIKDKMILFLFSMSKFHALAGLEVGYAIGNKELIKIITSNINYPISEFKEEIVISALIDNDYNNYVKKYYKEQRNYIISTLNNNNIDYIDSKKNFFYIKCSNENKLKEEFKKIKLKYDYSSEISEYTLFVINNQEINKKILDIYIKIINNLDE